jgi:hypothetical protein
VGRLHNNQVIQTSNIEMDYTKHEFKTCCPGQEKSPEKEQETWKRDGWHFRVKHIEFWYTRLPNIRRTTVLCMVLGACV